MPEITSQDVSDILQNMSNAFDKQGYTIKGEPIKITLVAHSDPAVVVANESVATSLHRVVDILRNVATARPAQNTKNPEVQ